MNTLPDDKLKYISKIVLNLITKSSTFKNQLQSTFPEIYSDIESASTNPNCSCRGKVESKVVVERDKALGVVNDLLSKQGDDPEIQAVINIPYDTLTPTYYGGKMFQIENSPEAYKQFYDTLLKEKATYRAFSTCVDANNKLLIHFV